MDRPPLAAAGALMLVLLLRGAAATLPADNGGAVSYSEGFLAPNFKVACSFNNGTAGNYSVASSSGRTTSAGAPLPSSLVILVVPADPEMADLFVQVWPTRVATPPSIFDMRARPPCRTW